MQTPLVIDSQFRGPPETGFAGTALFDESADLCAYSERVWIGRRATNDRLA